MVVAIYFFLRRFRSDSRFVGFPLDGALMTASASGVIGFAHAASTDMPLAAMFTVAMLAWYAWHESSGKRYLAAVLHLHGIGHAGQGTGCAIFGSASSC